jgi:hypothetical protein
MLGVGRRVQHVRGAVTFFQELLAMLVAFLFSSVLVSTSVCLRCRVLFVDSEILPVLQGKGQG